MMTWRDEGQASYAITYTALSLQAQSERAWMQNIIKVDFLTFRAMRPM